MKKNKEPETNKSLDLIPEEAYVEIVLDTGSKALLCKSCGKTYFKVNTVKNHIRKDHGPNGQTGTKRGAGGTADDLNSKKTKEDETVDSLEDTEAFVSEFVDAGDDIFDESDVLHSTGV